MTRYAVANLLFGRGCAFVLLLVALLCLAPAGTAQHPLVELQFLTVSDWHAQLDPLAGGIGGAAVLSAYWQADRAANPNTLTLTAGDAFGASPPLSGFFNEQPAVLAMNQMGFHADTLGNHNFDRGIAHLQQMIDLAQSSYVSANLKHVEDNLTGVAPFEIFNVGGVKVAVIGITNPEAPTLVFPGNFGTIEVTDPVPAANKARAAAKRAGAQIFVVICHLGVTSFDPVTGAPTGPLIDFANNVGGFDIIFGDHTDVQFSGIINNALVVENRSRGATYARTKLLVDPRNGRVLNRSVEFVTPLASAVTADPAVQAVLAPFRAALSAALDRVVGVATGIFVRGGNIERLQEVALGNLVTDVMRLRYGTQMAITNGGGLRAPLPSSYLPADMTLRRNTPGYAPGPPFDLVVGDAFAVLPFGNVVITRSVTGAQLYAALEHSVAPLPAANGRFLQVSGFRFTFDSSRPAGTRVVSVTLNDGTPIFADGTLYTLALNDFINAGGDGYTIFADGQGVSREVLADIVVAYIETQGTITPTVEGRIVDVKP
jgi:5'-nucleotidase